MVDNPIQYEVELVERLWNNGWAAFRTASSGPGAMANCDVVAFKDSESIILNLVVLETGNSSKKVHKENNDLEKIRRRAEPVSLDSRVGPTIGHAIKEVQTDDWKFANTDRPKVSSGGPYVSLNDVVNP